MKIQFKAIIIGFVFAFSLIPVYAQKSGSEHFVKGLYLKGGINTYKKAMILNWDDRELVFDQNGIMKAFAFGYSVIGKEKFFAGWGTSVNFATTGLNDFQAQKFDDLGSPSSVAPMLAYDGVKSSFLMFDFNGYMVPIKRIPFALNLGFTMGSSFQKYGVTGDSGEVLNANGDQSKSMFRYGYIVGFQIIPFRYISLDFEWRPMAAYSSSTHYTKLKYLYSKGGYNYYEVLASETEEGPSETFLSFGLSVHF
jgi:hypothetical protein